MDRFKEINESFEFFLKDLLEKKKRESRAILHIGAESMEV